MVAILIKCIDACKQLRVHHDARIVARHFGCDFALQCLNSLVGVSTGTQPENGGNAIKGLARQL